jgi:predicted nucleotidyltransferase
MDALITQNIARLQQICAANPVDRLFVFGSAAKGTLTNNSDVDLLFEYTDGVSIEDRYPTYKNLEQAFSAILGRKIDLLTFQMAQNPYFIDELNATAQKIYDCRG